MKEKDEEFIKIPETNYSNKLFGKMECIKTLLKAMESHNHKFYEAIIGALPSEYLDCLYEKRISKTHLETFKKENASKLTFMKDFRSLEELIYNYYLGLIVEVIAQKILNSLGHQCIRAGSDANFIEKDSAASTEADLYIESLNKSIEVKSTNFMSKYRALAIKSYQIKKYINNDYDIFVMDYESYPGKIYFAWFPLKGRELSEPVNFFGKICQYVNLKGLTVHYLDFTKNNTASMKDRCFHFNTFNKLTLLSEVNQYSFKLACQ